MTRVAIALGSNIDPAINIPEAARRISAIAPVIKASTVWESAPFGYTEQPNFLNAALLIETDLSPANLKAELLRIEEDLGRVRDPRNKNGPRTIDLDIALYGEEVIHSEGLQIPDPEIGLRPFLAIPLAEILPLMPHPVSGKLLAVIARSFKGQCHLVACQDLNLLAVSRNAVQK